ncbi:MAG: AIR synthase-related protein [Candidatus Bathyarchaeia archaeon]
MGKLATKKLEKLLSCIKKDPRVVIPPSPGFDSGVHKINSGKYLVVSTDPCVGVPRKWFGWLLIHYAASDIALFGAKPEFCTLNLLGPPNTKPRTFIEVMNQACKAADELGMAVVTGHTGTYEGLSTLVGACTAYGLTEKKELITPGGARVGDAILCTKPLGLEVVVNFAVMHKLARRLFGAERVRELSELVNMQSCVKEALLLAGMKGVHAMHDATEGGLVAALNEMAETAKVGFQIKLKEVPIAKEVYLLQKHFGLTDGQVLSMSSTGTILAAVSSKNKNSVLKFLHENGVEAKIIGFFTEKLQRIIIKDGEEKKFPAKAEDPYEMILSGKV